MAKEALKLDQAEGREVEPLRPLAGALQQMATAARASGDWLRVFDVRYATAGIPTEITNEFVLYPPGSIEVLETGNLNEPSVSFEVLKFPKLIALHAIVHAELCAVNKKK